MKYRQGSGYEREASWRVRVFNKTVVIELSRGDIPGDRKVRLTLTAAEAVRLARCLTTALGQMVGVIGPRGKERA
jgi:hypothetical protein